MKLDRRAELGAIFSLVALAAAGCSDDEPSGPAGAIQMAVNPGSISVPQGGTGSATVTLTRIGGFGGPVTLAATGLPAGVTVTFTPAQLTGAAASAAVEVSVTGAVPLATYSATISATAQGVDEVTVAFGLTVTAAPDFVLTVNPAALTVVAGTSGNGSIAIARTAFPGNIAFALRTPPAGITGQFAPTPTAANEVALVVSVDANMAPGAYPLTIDGTGTGPGVRSTTLQLTVPEPPAGGNVEYLFCGSTGTPVFFAYQDGSGAWQSVTASTSGGATRFAFNLTQGYGGVLMVHQGPVVAAARVSARFAGPGRSAAMVDAYETEVRYASAAELAQDGFESCASSQPTKSVSGSIVGVAAGMYATVSLGGVTTIFDGAASTNPVMFREVPAGPVDLIGSRTLPGSAPNRMLIVRDLNIPNGGSLPSSIDFAGPASFVPAGAFVTISGGGGDNLEAYTDLVTANGRGGYWSDLSPNPSTVRPWAGLPQASMMTGDLHGLVVFASPTDESGDYRVSLRYVGPVADQDLTMGPSLEEPAVSPVAAGAYPRFRFQGILPPEYHKGAEIYLLGEEAPGSPYSIIATSAWLTALGNGQAYDFTMPDVAALAGFPVASRLQAGSNAMVAGGFGFTGAGIFDLRPGLGGEYKAAVRNTTVDVP